jgi:hypothetical protein
MGRHFQTIQICYDLEPRRYFVCDADFPDISAAAQTLAGLQRKIAPLLAQNGITTFDMTVEHTPVRLMSRS